MTKKVNEVINKISRVNKKIIVAGEGGVGRTALLYRYTENYFKNDTILTRGLQIFAKRVKIDNNNFNFVFWDLGGQKRWRFFHSDFCKGADGAILAFDLRRYHTLKNIGEWVNILRSWNRNLPIVFLGMKLDLNYLCEDVDDYCMKLLEEYKFIDFIKVSCKTGENVQKTFQSLFSHVLNVPKEKIPVIKYVDERTRKIEGLLRVSNRIKLDMMRTALNMEKKAFDEKIFEWAEEFGFIIDGDVLIVDKDTVSSYINELDVMFETWEKSEKKIS